MLIHSRLLRLLSSLLVAFVLSESAHAGCCTLRKVDTTYATVTLRACEPNASNGCATVLFNGSLSVGQSQQVCSAQDTVLYQEAAPGEPFGPYVEALCTGEDVEI